MTSICLSTSQLGNSQPLCHYVYYHHSNADVRLNVIRLTSMSFNGLHVDDFCDISIFFTVITFYMNDFLLSSSFSSPHRHDICTFNLSCTYYHQKIVIAPSVDLILPDAIRIVCITHVPHKKCLGLKDCIQLSLDIDVDKR